MLQQTGLLKHIAQRTLPRRNKHAAGRVLPHGTGHGHMRIRPIAGALQPGHAAQQGGFARTRWTEQDRDAPPRQAQVHIEHKARARQPQADVGLRNRVCRLHRTALPTFRPPGAVRGA